VAATRWRTWSCSTGIAIDRNIAKRVKTRQTASCERRSRRLEPDASKGCQSGS
jgi:hypothetical protein